MLTATAMMLSMNARSAVVVVAALSFLISACSKSAPAPGKVVTIDKLCDEADESRVRVSGYLRYRRGLLSFCSTMGGQQTCDLALYAAPEAPPDFSLMRPQKGPEPLHARLSVPVGDKAGEMDDLPKKFKPSDIELHLPSGANATEGSRVTIDGKLSVIPQDPSAKDAPKSCFVNVEWVSAG